MPEMIGIAVCPMCLIGNREWIKESGLMRVDKRELIYNDGEGG